MDYNSIHGPGISNFSPSPHRRPTVSAAQALQDLKSSQTRCIPTGLPLLDCALQNREPVTGDEDQVQGGVSRGKVTEIYGPPGIGKTTLGIQLAANALKAGEGVVWVDGSHQVSGRRLMQILSLSQNSSPDNPDQLNTQMIYDKLTHFSIPTLSHFIAFFAEHSSSVDNDPLSNAGLVVIDSFSTLIANAYPRNADSNLPPRKPGEPNLGARKFGVVKTIINILQKVAARRNIAIVILSACVTKMRLGMGAALVPAINSTTWEQVLGCIIALFKDFGWRDENGVSIQDVRYAQVLKAEGIVAPEGRSKAFAFSILESGLIPITPPIVSIPAPRFKSPIKISPHPLSHFENQPPNSTPTLPILHPPQKRKFGDLEIPDSDDEDYGWDEEDEEELPPPPPQWQGTEDDLDPGKEVEREEERVEEDEELDELAGDPEPDPNPEVEKSSFESAKKTLEAENREKSGRVIYDSEDELAA